MIKKAIIITIVLAIVMLASCGTPSPQVETQTETSQPDQQANATGEQTTISFVSWMSGGEHIPFIEQFMAENPDIIVEYECVDGNNYDTLMKVKLMSDDAPDVYMLQPSQIARYAIDGYLMDLSGQPLIDLLNTNKDFVNAVSFNGAIVGFPTRTGGGPIPIYYNKKYFEEKGFTVPKTVEEFYELCSAIKADGMEPLVYGGADSWIFEYFFRYRHYSGMIKDHPQWAQMLYKQEMTPSEFFAKEFEMAQYMYDQGYISPASLTLNHSQSAGYFVDGKAALLPQGPWEPSMPEILEANPETFELACFTSPVNPADDGIIYSTGEIEETMVVSANTDKKDAALRFANWFASPEVLSKYLENTSSTTLLQLDYKINPVIEDHIKSISSDKYSIIMSQNVILPAGFMTESCFTVFTNMLAGSSAEAELARMDTEFDKVRENSIVLE